MDDLDDLLDDIEIDESLQAAADGASNDIAADLPGMSEDVLKKWSKFISADEGADKASKFLYSHIYRCWDDSKNPAKTLPAHKLLQDAVRQACTKCGFNDKRTAKVLNVANPMETDSGKQLQDAYNRQILSDFKRSVLTNPDYDPEQFPSLAAIYAKN